MEISGKRHDKDANTSQNSGTALKLGNLAGYYFAKFVNLDNDKAAEFLRKEIETFEEKGYVEEAKLLRKRIAEYAIEDSRLDWDTIAKMEWDIVSSRSDRMKADFFALYEKFEHDKEWYTALPVISAYSEIDKFKDFFTLLAYNDWPEHIRRQHAYEGIEGLEIEASMLLSSLREEMRKQAYTWDLVFKERNLSLIYDIERAAKSNAADLISELPPDNIRKWIKRLNAAAKLNTDIYPDSAESALFFSKAASTVSSNVTNRQKLNATLLSIERMLLRYGTRQLAIDSLYRLERASMWAWEVLPMNSTYALNKIFDELYQKSVYPKSKGKQLNLYDKRIRV